MQAPLSQRYALRAPDGRKVLHAPGEFEVLFPAPQPWELYHLVQDPGETRNLAPLSGAEADDELRALRDRLLEERARLETAGAALGELESGELDSSTREQLEALGYFGGKDED